jgi:sulfopyruvate decarboxylase TPP-binding subunit
MYDCPLSIIHYPLSIMLDGPAVTVALETCGITHVVWVPDSLLGTWEPALLKSNSIRLIRACREGEAIAVAGGLLLGGAKPAVLIQCTGLFEAGDALRNIVHDLKLPLVLIVGVRSYLAHQAGTSADNCPAFTRPILNAWKIPQTLIDPNRHSANDLIAAIGNLHRSGQAGAILIAE